MPSSVPAENFNGFIRPEIHFDANGNIILDGPTAAAAAAYGTKFIYGGLPANTPVPPIPDSVSTPVDSNGAGNTVVEGAAVNTAAGVTAFATSSVGNTVTYSLVGDTSGGGFKIDANTGVVTVANPAKIDFETAPGHAYSIIVQANDGILTALQTFSIGVGNVAPTAPVDGNAAANTVAEGAAANTAAGVTASSSDINGPGVTWSLTADSSGGGFRIDPVTGVVSVADPTRIDYETSGAGHSYTVTARASDGTLASSQTFTIAVTDVSIGAPVDGNAAANSVVEDAANGTAVGITASAIDPNGPATTYALIGDTSNGGFTINGSTGIVTVADHSKIDFEGSGGSYNIIVKATNGATITQTTFAITVTDAAPTTPVDSNAAANSVAEGAANGSTVGITASSTDVNGPAVTYSLTGDTSGGGFTINATTGVVTVADSSKIDFETSGAGHSYTVTAKASDGTLSSSQSFTISVADVAPSTPVDSNAGANSVAEGAAAGSTVGLTASSTDVNGPAVAWSLTGDTSGGGFSINAATGVVTVADPSKIDYETAPGHSYTVTARASDGTLTSSQTFTIGVTDVAPSTPVDGDAASNNIVEGAAAGTAAGVTASSTDLNGPAVTYSLTGDTSGGGFAINAATGVITVADPTKIDYETSGGSYTVTAQATDGTLSSSQSFTIAVTDVAPSTPVDGNAAANTVAEGAANGSTVGVTASSTDVNGPAVTWSLTGDTSGGGFTINAATGVVTVADTSKIDFETSGGSYTVTTRASDGTLASSQTFTIAVTDVTPSTPVDSNAAANSVAEGAAAGSTVGLTASSTDVNGPPVTWSLTGDTSGGGFTINATTGVVTVADPSKIDFETSGATHSYTVTAQASDGTIVASQAFTIDVTDVSPSTPVDADANANTIAEAAANGSTVGVTASSTDVNGPAVTYSLTGDTSGGGFTINATTGVVTIADSTKIDFESSGGSYTVTATASDGTLASSQTFTVAVTDIAPTTPVDSDGATNQVSQNAPVGTYTGVTASSTDLNGPAVTYSITGDTSGGGFTVDASTGQVKVADSSKIIYSAGSPTYDVTVRASDGTLNSQQTFTIAVILNAPPVANDDAASATEAGGANNAVAGVNPSGNVVTGVGAGSVADTDAEDPSSALTVVEVHTGPEGGSTGTGTVNSPLIGSHGTLTLNTNGSYTYTVNQSDSAVQALHTSADTLTDQFNYKIQDTGGLQDTASLTFTIHGANDLPVAVADTGTMTEDDAPTSFNVIANDSQDPDSTATNAITLGPAGITVTGPAGTTFVNTDATAAIVSNQIQVTLNNSHFQQLALGEHATVTIPYTLTGDAGDTSGANLVVTVDGVNDVPAALDDSGSMTEDQSGNAFTVLTNDTLDADHSAPNNVTVNAATAVTNLVAPSGENIDTSDVTVSVNGTNQVVVNLGADFQHMKDGESATFDVAYTLHGDQAGDTSTATLHVTVTGVNDAPVAANFTFNAANSAIGNTDLVVNDPTDGAPDPAGPQKTISASIVSGASDVDGPGPLVVVAGTIATANGGSVTMQSDGDFIYKPPVGYTGSDSFTYQVSDQNAGASGVGLASGTITINVAAPKVWYVNAATGNDATGDGTSEKPFASLAPLSTGGSADALDGANDTIFLYNGTYNSGIVLENGQQLISQSVGLTVNSTALEAASGSNAVINGTVTLASGNTIDGIDFGNTSGFALQDSGATVGTATVAHSLINNANGGAVNIANGGTLAMAFSSITASGTSTSAIALNNTTGTFTASGGTLNNGAATAADVAITGANNVNFTYDGSINDTTGTTVSIANQTGGTKDFNGLINGAAISLTNNTGATMSFDGGVTLSTGTANAFTATGGGTVTVTGANNTLTTGTGTTLNIANTTIGSGNVTFKTVSASGAVNAIVLNNTGTSGHLAVTGTGTTAGSGGTITNTTGDSISLTSTQDVSLSNMSISGSDGYGIVGHSLTGLVLNNDSITGSGDSTAGDGEGNIYLYELTGNASHATTFDNLTVSNSYVHNVFINNTGGTLTDLVVTDSTFSNNGASTHAGSEFVINLASGGVAGTPTATLHATHNTFSGNLSTPATFTATGLQASVDDGTLNVHIGDGTAGGLNTFDTNNSGITLSSSNAGNLNFDVNDNIVTHNRAVGVAINHFGTGTVTGFFRNNTIGTLGDTHSGAEIGNGLDIHDEGTAGTVTLSVTNNIIQSVGSGGLGFEGVNVQQLNGAQNSSGVLNLTFTGNTIRDIIDDRGLFINEGNTAGGGAINAVVSGNTFSNANASGANTTARVGGAPGGTNAVNVTQANAATLASDNGLTASGAPGNTMRVDTNVSFNHAAPPAPPATPQLAAVGQGPGDSHVLTTDALAPLLAVAIEHWAAAGVSAAQIAQIKNTQIHIADLPDSGVLANTDSSGITIDRNAAGWGWFVDPTPGDNSEFHATASPTELLAGGGAAAAHIDLLTVIEHEMGHVIGLEDSAEPGVMNIALDLGERRLPDAADVALASGGSFPFAASASAASVTLAVAAVTGNGPASQGLVGNHVADASIAQGVIATADAFVFASTPANAPPPAQVIGTHPFQSHHFDFSSLPFFHQGGGFDGLVAHALADHVAALQSYAAGAADTSAGAWLAPQDTGGLLETLFHGVLARIQDLHL